MRIVSILVMLAATCFGQVPGAPQNVHFEGPPSAVKLRWSFPTNNLDGTPLTDLAGAKVYYGTSSSNYTHTLDVGMTNACTVTGLDYLRVYYFNGTAYNTAGLESDFCTEVAKRTRLDAVTVFVFQ